MIQIKVWEARTKKQLTLMEVAELTQLSKSTINNIENAKTSPTLEELECIAKALDVKMSDLYNSEYK